MNLSEMLAKADAATQGVEIKDGDFPVIKPGTYDVAVTAAEGPLPSKRANYANPNEFGQQIKLTLSIVGGEYNGRTLFLWNNILVYPSSPSGDDLVKAQKAMAIGAKERKVMLDSIGKTSISVATELVGATFKAQVKVTQYNGKDRNEVNKVLPLNNPLAQSAAPAFVAPAATPSAPAPSAPSASLPWAR